MPETIYIGSRQHTFNKVWYVAVDGNDANDGSKDNPLLSVNTAVTKAATGDAIVAGEGSFDVTRIAGTYDSGGLWDGGKGLTFVGVPGKTVFICDGRRHSGRDTHCIMFTNAGTKAYHIIFDFYTNNRANNYSVAVCGNGAGTPVRGEVINCVISIIGTTAPSMTYSNDGTSTVKFTNCVFNVGQNFRGSYSGGGGVRENCVCNYAFANEGTITTCAYNLTWDAEYRITSAESLWKNKGTGTDLDGSVADLGVYGGPYVWRKDAIIVIDAADKNAFVPKNTDHVFDFSITQPDPSYTSEETPMTTSVMGSGRVFSADLVLIEWKDITKLVVVK